MELKLKDKSDIEGTCWIEFNISGTSDKYDHWADSSKYLDEYAYNLFTDIFEQNGEDFDYYGSTNYTLEQLDKIKRAIADRTSDLNKLQVLDDLIGLSDKSAYALNLADELRENHEKHNGRCNELVDDIKELANCLTNLLDKCIAEKKTLWVLGL